MAKLERQHPNADTELHFRTPYELLVATILSAQCTDERVNQVTPALFARYPDARALARATTDELEPQIQSTGFFRAKSQVARRHGDRRGRAAPRRDPGDDGGARASCPASAARPRTSCWAMPSACPACRSIVTCCACRTGSGSRRGDDPEVVEQQLCAAMPPAKWTRHLGHADPSRPPHLQAASAVRSMCGAGRLQLLPHGRWGSSGPRARGSRSSKRNARSRPRAPKARGTGRGVPPPPAAKRPPRLGDLAGASEGGWAPRQTKIHDPRALHPARRRSAARHPAALSRRDEERRRHRRGRAAAAHSRGAGGGARRHAVRSLSGHSPARAQLEPRQYAARPHLDLPAARSSTPATPRTRSATAWRRR